MIVVSEIALTGWPGLRKSAGEALAASSGVMRNGSRDRVVCMVRILVESQLHDPTERAGGCPPPKTEPEASATVCEEPVADASGSDGLTITLSLRCAGV